MAVPTISSITPTQGRSLGEDLVKITGTNFNLSSIGTVEVFFAGRPAVKVGVASTTTLLVQTPEGIVGPADILVRNVTPNPPGSDIVEDSTPFSGFTYVRPIIKHPADRTQGGIINQVMAALISDLRNKVLENTHWKQNSEYVDPFSEMVPESKQSSFPSLALLGPRVRDDQFYNPKEPAQVDLGGGIVVVRRTPATVELTIQYIGVDDNQAGVTNLMEALDLYLERTDYLKVPLDGVSIDNGFAEIELNRNWPDVARFNNTPTRQNNYQFTGSFRLNGVNLRTSDIDEIAQVNEIICETDTNVGP